MKNVHYRRTNCITGKAVRFKPAVFTLLILLPLICQTAPRKIEFAGKLYPADTAQLSNDVDGYIKSAVIPELSGKVAAVIAPHSGYQFSGNIAGYTYAALRETRCRTAVIIGPSHSRLLGYGAIYSKGAYASPLGEVPVNERMVNKLINASKNFKLSMDVHSGEHSIEAQLPFLQRTFGKFMVVPILLNGMGEKNLLETGKKLASVMKTEDDCLLIISTDLSHYPAYSEAVASDTAILREIEFMNPASVLSMDASILSKKNDEQFCTACGIDAVVAGLSAALELGAVKGKILRYSNSANVPKLGDATRVTGFGSVVFLNQSGKTREVRSHRK